MLKKSWTVEAAIARARALDPALQSSHYKTIAPIWQPDDRMGAPSSAEEGSKDTHQMIQS